MIGTSQRLTSGASNVLQYTMVDAKGDVYKVKILPGMMSFYG